MKKKRLSIITPCYNAAKYIQDTIKSVLSNTVARINIVDIEYIICDGGSEDGTVDIAEDLLMKCGYSNLTTRVISEKDSGMYDALAKGLKAATGDIVSYLNAGDLYSPHALEIVFDIFERLPVKWLTGFTVLYNELNHVVGVWLPFRYRRNLIQCGFYDQRLPFIQQESTFWSRDLLELIDYNQLKSYKFAGDHYLWQKFAEKTDLFIVEAWLGGWKIHSGQISEEIDAYRGEMQLFSKKPSILDYATAFYDRLHFVLPNDLKKRLNQKTLIRFDFNRQKYVLPGIGDNS